MFGRSSHSESKVVDPAKSPPASTGFVAPAAGAASPAPSSYQSPGNGSVVASDLTIVGQKVLLISQGRLQVDGEIRGDINGREVVIGQTGKVTGTITAQTIDVRGKIDGALKASTVTLQPTARVEGDITKMVLVVQEGAHFDGNVRRAKNDGEITPNLDPAQTI